MRWITLARTVHRYWRMAHDPRTPNAVRYLIYGGIAYTVIPDDWKPDWMPGLGLLDDAAVIPMTVALAMTMVPKEVKQDAEREQTERVAGVKAPDMEEAKVPVARPAGTPAFVPVSSLP